MAGNMMWGFIFPVNEFGDKERRRKSEYPYSYDGFVTYRMGNNKEANNTVYSDRMMQWDMVKYNRCVKQVLGDERQVFYSVIPEDIEKILRLYFDDENIKLILVMEYCNVSNGYPTWRFDFYKP